MCDNNGKRREIQKQKRYKTEIEACSVHKQLYTNMYMMERRKNKRTERKKMYRKITTTTIAQLTITDMRDTLYSCIIIIIIES